MNEFDKAIGTLREQYDILRSQLRAERLRAIGEPAPWRPEDGDWVRRKGEGTPHRVESKSILSGHLWAHVSDPGLPEARTLMATDALEPWTPRVGERVRYRKPSGVTSEGIVSDVDATMATIRVGAIPVAILPFADLEPAPAKGPCENTETLSPGRTVRLPAIGQRVKTKGGIDGTVAYSTIRRDGKLTSHVLLPGGTVEFFSESLTPVGDEPRWITITMPEEGE